MTQGTWTQEEQTVDGDGNEQNENVLLQENRMEGQGIGTVVGQIKGEEWRMLS